MIEKVFLPTAKRDSISRTVYSPHGSRQVWPKTLRVPSQCCSSIDEHHVSFSELLLKALRTVRGPALTELFRQSVKHGGRFDTADHAGMQLLHHAASLGRGEVTLFLLQARADSTARCKQGLTPLEYAVGYFQSVESCCQGFEDDYEASARACIEMQRLNDSRQSRHSVSKLALIRQELSHAATKLALFSPWRAQISKEAVLNKASVPRGSVQDYGEKLWIGWPYSFLRLRGFSEEVSEQQSSFDADFVRVRWRLQCNKIGASSNRHLVHFDLRPRKVAHPANMEYIWRDGNWQPCSNYIKTPHDINTDLEEYMDLKRSIYLDNTTMSWEEEYDRRKDRSHYTHHARRIKRISCTVGQHNARTSARVSYSAKLAHRGRPDGFRKFVQACRFGRGVKNCAGWREEVREALILAKEWNC